VARNPRSADADEVGERSRDLLSGSTPSSDALDDVLGEVVDLAEAFAVGVVLAAGPGEPGVQALRKNVRAWRGWCRASWSRAGVDDRG
jgi:hypothetical protein